MAVGSPSFALRGVVEGFYGPPWSHEQRLELVKFFGRECRFNIYIYAPKDDPFHREKWMEPYPPDQLDKLRELVDECKKYSIELCFAISPGLSIRHSSEGDFRKLTEKVQAMMSMGVRWFGLFLDDVPEELKDEGDKKAFGSLAEAQAHLANKLEQYLRAKNETSNLIICPTQYYLVEPTPYLQTLGERVLPSICIMWTGRGVVSKELTCKDADTYGLAVKRKPFVWDNYPVNDYNRYRLFLGPYRGREKQLPVHLSGIVSNPMNEAEASKIPLLTIGDCLWDSDNYDPELSWDSALRKVGGKNAYQHLKLFAEQSQSSYLWQNESPKLKALIEDVWVAWGTDDWRKSLTALNLFLGRLRRLRADLSSTLKNKQLLKEITPYLEKLELLATLGERTVELLRALKAEIRERVQIVEKLSSDVKELSEKCRENSHQICGELRMKFSFEAGKPPPDKDSMIVEFADKALALSQRR